MRRRLLFPPFLLLVLLVLAPLASAAPPQAAFGLRAVGNPQSGYFVYSTGAGSTKEGTVIVSNTGTAAGSVRLYTADATTGDTTGTVYLTDSAPTKTGAWVSLSAHTVTLAPGKHVSVTFTVHVPAGTPTGQYVGGIVAEATEKQPGTSSGGKTSVNIKIRNLSIMAVQVDVPGPTIHKFTIGEVLTGGTHGFQQVIVRVSNQGNVFEKPKGVVTIYDASGKPVETLDFSMDTFLPHTVIDYPIELKKALVAGSYSAAVSLHYAAAGAQTVTAKPTFHVTKQDVEKVFTSAGPTAAPPKVTTTAPATTTAPTTTAPTTTAAPTTTVIVPAASSTSSGNGPWLWVALGAIALLLLALLALVARRRGGAAPPVAPAPVAPAPVAPAPVAPAASLLPQAEPSPPAPVPATRSSAAAACDPYHYWDVRYDEPVQGTDGVWRFPHRCRNCGLELLARDVADATARADALR